MLLHYFYNVKTFLKRTLTIFDNICSYGSTPTLKDLPPALSSNPTYVLANAQPQAYRADLEKPTP